MSPFVFWSSQNRGCSRRRRLTPGKLFIFNANDGTAVATLDCVDIADDMTWESVSRRIYVTGSQGASVFKQQAKDEYVPILRQLPTNEGKTSVYAPELKRVYIIHPKTTTDNTALLI